MANKDFLFRAKADTSNYDANLARARQNLNGFAKANLSAGGAIKQLSSSLVSVAARVASVTAAVGALGAAIRSNISTALNFEKSMSQLSSLTGMVGKDLEKLKGYAIELGSTTTLTASQVADAFKMIGSQQPQLLASGEALKSVTKNAITLAEAAGIELADAARTLSVSINQMGGDSANAERYINVLAAASQKGAGDIAWLGEAITKSGTTARAVGTDYEELVANLEQLAKAGYDASTAGTALRSIIMNLEKKASNEFKPSVVGLTQAFENLGKANLTLTGYQEMAGKMFAAQAKALAEASGEAKKMREEITGTNIAEEQAKTNTDNLDGSLKSLASAWEGLNLHINDSNGFLRTCVDRLKDVVKWADQTFTSAGRAAAQLERLRGGQQGSDNDIVQKDLNKVMSAPEADKQAVYEQIAATYTESENAKWRKVNEAKARLNSLGKYDPFGEKAKLEETIKKNTEWAEQFRTLGDEFRRKGKQYLDSISPSVVQTNELIEEEEREVKTIKELTAKIKELKQARDEAADAGDHDLVEEYNNSIKRIQDEIKLMRGTKKNPKTSKSDVTPTIINDSRTGLGFGLGGPQSMNDLRKTLLYYQSLMNSATTQDEYRRATAGISATKTAIAAQPKALELGISIAEASVLQSGEAMKEMLEEYFKKHPLTFNVGNNLSDEGEDAKDSWKSAAQAIQSVGSAMQSIEDPAAKVAGLVAQAIATVATAYAQALATDWTSKSNIWSFIAAAAASTASMITTIAAIHNATGYAEGGIVKGNSYSGDNIPADTFVNSGELVLNRAQQGTLAAQLSGSNGGGVSSLPYVTGEKIVLGINNWAKQTGRGQLVFSKS